MSQLPPMDHEDGPALGSPIPPDEPTIAPVLRRVTRRVESWECQCVRCGYRWYSERATPPDRCPGCKARNWNETPRTYTRRTPSSSRRR